MADHRALAVATEALRRLLEGPVRGAFDTARVTTLQADEWAGRQGAGVNLLLVHATPSSGHRSTDIVMRDAAGNVIRVPASALDLHYLLTCYGEGLEPQRLLGVIWSVLSGHPVLGADLLRQASEQGPAWAAGCDLQHQDERLVLVPQALSPGELLALWRQVYDAPYQLSMAVQLSVVMVDGATPEPVR